MFDQFDPLSEMFALSTFQRAVVQGIADSVDFKRFMTTSLPRRAMNQPPRKVYITWQDKWGAGYTAYLDLNDVITFPNGWILKRPGSTADGGKGMPKVVSSDKPLLTTKEFNEELANARMHLNTLADRLSDATRAFYKAKDIVDKLEKLP